MISAAARLRRLGRLLFGAGLAFVLSSVLLLVSGLPAQADVRPMSLGTLTESAVTVDWATEHTDQSDPNYAAFRNLSFTVNQTDNLSHQGVTISWSGGTPTSLGEYASNFLQIMQCWGDTAEPTPQQCQFGTPADSVASTVGSLVGTRELEVGADPGQPLTSSLRIPGLARAAYEFPFTSVNGSTTFNFRELFDSSTTNEVTAARTGADGSGSVTFEVQTTLEAPHLGCGAEIVQSDGSSYPRACWLVIVPRSDKDPNGGRAQDASGRISGSPLTASNWKNRVVVPLGFQSVSRACPLGQAEKRLVGSEMIANAMTSWQPALCGSGTTYGFSMIADAEAREQITGADIGASRLGFVSSGVASDNAEAAHIKYAPVSESAIVIAYNIDYNLFRDSSVYAKNGTQVTNLKLNQRLVAKLLTQSYQVDNPGYGADDPVIAANPRGIVDDPEFVALNPDFARYTKNYPQGLLVPFGNSDVTAHVWNWIRANADAKNFLLGQADPFGMKINPEYLSLGLASGEAPVSYPKSDLSIFRNDPSEPGYGTLDMRPFYNNMGETAYRALRADGNIKMSWDPFKVPPRYVAIPPQPSGERFMLAITDSASAARYGLQVAQIANQHGDYVAPNSSSMARAIAAMGPGTAANLKTTDFSKAVANAYPLAELTYAAVSVCKATPEELSAYAKFISYAVGEGQVSGSQTGQLPAGYFPLSSAQKALARTVASTIKNTSSVAAECTPATPSFVTDPGQSSGGTGSVKMSKIRVPFTAAGAVTEDEIPLIPRILIVLGFVVGLPLMFIGPLLMRRARRLQP